MLLRSNGSRAITLSPSTLKKRSLCIRSMCRPMCIFCLARYTQYGHWNWGSLPHSHFWWLRSDDLSLYTRPQSGHANPIPEPFASIELHIMLPILLLELPQPLPVLPVLPTDPGFTSTGLTESGRGKISGTAPSRNVVTRGIALLDESRGIARRASSWSQVRPPIFVMLKSSATKNGEKIKRKTKCWNKKKQKETKVP